MASSLLGLAPGGGYLAIRITADAGGLLHHLFTITYPLPALPKLGKGLGGGRLFVSVALSGRFAPCGDSPPRMLSDAVLYGVPPYPFPDKVLERFKKLLCLPDISLFKLAITLGRQTSDP